MSATVRRGSSFRIKFRPVSNVNFATLGTPFITIQQELMELVPEAHLDSENNMVYADVSESESITLVEDVETQAQLMFSNEDGTSYRFMVHNITVLPTLFGTRTDEIQNREEQEPLPGTSTEGQEQSSGTSGDDQNVQG